MFLFDLQDYREAIKQIIEQKQKTIRTLTFQSVAQQCRIQKGYLSRVVAKSADLSRDQLFLFCDAMHLDPQQRNFLFLLHDFNRAGVEKRKIALGRELEQLRAKAAKTEGHIRYDKLISDDVSQFSKYYLDINTQLVHMFLTVQRYRNDLSLIESALRIDSTQMHQHLARLEELGLIKIEGAKISILRDELHLSADHPIFPIYRSMMRIRATSRLQENSDADNYSYSAFVSASSNTRILVKKRFLAFLKELQKEVGTDNPQEVFQINFDVLSWSK